jgi:hypothetical protein
MEYAVWLIAACLGAITVLLAVWLGFLLYVLIQLRRTALAVEALAYTVRHHVDRLQETAEIFRDYGRSGWGQALAIGLGSAFAYWNRRRGPDCA